MKELICIVCPKGCHLRVDETTLAVTGNSCPRGEQYGRTELANPTRTISSTVRIEGAAHRRCPVKTDGVIPKGMIFSAMKALDAVTLTAPVKLGQIVVGDVCGTGVNIVTTRAMEATL